MASHTQNITGRPNSIEDLPFELFHLSDQHRPYKSTEWDLKPAEVANIVRMFKSSLTRLATAPELGSFFRNF